MQRESARPFRFGFREHVDDGAADAIGLHAGDRALAQLPQRPHAFGQQRGLQTLVLKSKHRSAYVRLFWDTVMGDAAADKALIEQAIRSAIRELS